MGDKAVFLNGGNESKFSRKFVESLSKIFFEDWYILEEKNDVSWFWRRKEIYWIFGKKNLSGLSS